jgi:hypothetical protein
MALLCVVPSLSPHQKYPGAPRLLLLFFLLGNAIFISLSQIASREVVNKVKERFYVVFVVIAYQIPS